MVSSDNRGPRPTNLGSLSGKDKAARVPLDYFRRARKPRVAVTLAALGVVGAALAVSLVSGAWRDLSSPGKIHSVHAAWERDCSVCHQPLQPTSSRNGLQKTLGIGPVADHLCQNCHSGPPHHLGAEVPGEAATCASCHVEHRGRFSQLANSDDSSCRRCHDDLAAHFRSDRALEFANHITGFNVDHPQFNLGPPGQRKPLPEARDPSNLTFNHQAHLTAGVRYSDTDVKGWTLGDIRDKTLRERYRRQQPAGQKEDKDRVQLDCASCHQLDGADAPKAGPGQNPPLRTRGDYMLPVTYEQHCKACHPLTFDPALPDVEIPHLLQPPEVKRFLWGVYAGQEVAARPEKREKGRPLPGANVSRAEKEARDRIRGRTGAAETFLFQKNQEKASQLAFMGKTTCGLCHSFGMTANAGTPTTILPPAIPQVWYSHARFSHRAHRAMQCADCHAGAAQSSKNSDVLLPGIENCRTCHAPRSSVAGVKRGGVRQECTTCHRYHDGAAPDAGLGSRARGVQDRLPLQEFLNGAGPESRNR